MEELWYGERSAMITFRTDKFGTLRWYKDGKEHRDGDLPAWIDADGNQYWFKDGKLHRDGDLPAIIGANGTQIWYKDGKWVK